MGPTKYLGQEFTIEGDLRNITHEHTKKQGANYNFIKENKLSF
jgi:hypothetical protein